MAKRKRKLATIHVRPEDADRFDKLRKRPGENRNRNGQFTVILNAYFAYIATPKPAAPLPDARLTGD